MKKVIIAPSNYIQGNGEIKHLNDYVEKLGKVKPYLLVDSLIYSKYEADITVSFKEKNVDYVVGILGGECSDAEIAIHIEAMKDCDVVIGIGGGKTIDTAKAAADACNTPVIIVPTSASTDAPCSRMSVVYNKEGLFEHFLFFKANPDYVIMDLDIIVHAPVRFIVSGMGDAMATYYEAMASSRANSLTVAGGYASRTALAIAREGRNILLEDGYRAKLAVERGACSRAVENVVEANTYISGVGFENGGVCTSHAISDGLGAIESLHRFLHGEKVAFGLVCQLMMENNFEELDIITKFFKQVGLPVCFKDLGIEDITDEQIMEIAKLTCAEGEAIYNSDAVVTVEFVADTIKATDAYCSRF